MLSPAYTATVFFKGDEYDSEGRSLKAIGRKYLAQLLDNMAVTNQSFGSRYIPLSDGSKILIKAILKGPVPVYQIVAESSIGEVSYISNCDKGQVVFFREDPVDSSEVYITKNPPGYSPITPYYVNGVANWFSNDCSIITSWSVPRHRYSDPYINNVVYGTQDRNGTYHSVPSLGRNVSIDQWGIVKSIYVRDYVLGACTLQGGQYLLVIHWAYNTYPSGDRLLFVSKYPMTGNFEDGTWSYDIGDTWEDYKICEYTDFIPYQSFFFNKTATQAASLGHTWLSSWPSIPTGFEFTNETIYYNVRSNSFSKGFNNNYGRWTQNNTSTTYSLVYNVSRVVGIDYKATDNSIVKLTMSYNSSRETVSVCSSNGGSFESVHSATMRVTAGSNSVTGNFLANYSYSKSIMEGGTFEGDGIATESGELFIILDVDMRPENIPISYRTFSINYNKTRHIELSCPSSDIQDCLDTPQLFDWSQYYTNNYTHTRRLYVNNTLLCSESDNSYSELNGSGPVLGNIYSCTGSTVSITVEGVNREINYWLDGMSTSDNGLNIYYLVDPTGLLPNDSISVSTANANFPVNGHLIVEPNGDYYYSYQRNWNYGGYMFPTNPGNDTAYEDTSRGDLANWNVTTYSNTHASTFGVALDHPDRVPE